MDLCSNGHEEICYEGNSCPACDLLSQVADLEADKKKLELELDQALADQG
jgi:hypothetical protein